MYRRYYPSRPAGNAADEKKEDMDIEKILSALQEIQNEVKEIKKILQTIIEEGSDVSSGEEVL